MFAEDRCTLEAMRGIMDLKRPGPRLAAGYMANKYRA
jgi:hypothetical protein